MLELKILAEKAQKLKLKESRHHVKSGKVEMARSLKNDLPKKVVEQVVDPMTLDFIRYLGDSEEIVALSKGELMHKKE